MSLPRLTSLLFCIGSASAAIAAVPPSPSSIDRAKSKVTATAKQLGVPIEGAFNKVSGNIVFDPAHPAQSSARVEIEVASYDMGAPEYNKEVAGKDWFNAAQFPKAIFASSSIVAAGAGKFTVAGKLTLKGHTVAVTFPATFKTEGGQSVFDGTLPIKRGSFTVGDGEWKDTSVVADEVLIKFHVVTAPIK